MAKKKNPSYTDQERANLVVMLESEGYPGKDGALTRVSNYSGVSRSTLRSWFNKKHNPPPANLRHEKRKDLADMFEDEVYEIFGVLEGKREDASYRELATSAGIFIDKMRLLRGMPTEIVAIIPGLVEAIQDAGHNPKDVLEQFRQHMLTQKVE